MDTSNKATFDGTSQKNWKGGGQSAVLSVEDTELSVFFEV